MNKLPQVFDLYFFAEQAYSRAWMPTIDSDARVAASEAQKWNNLLVKAKPGTSAERLARASYFENKVLELVLRHREAELNKDHTQAALYWDQALQMQEGLHQATRKP